MTVTTQQQMILIGFSTLCGVVLASFLGLILYALVRDGTAASHILDIIQTTLQWGLTGIAGVLGIHTAVAGGLLGRPVPSPTTTPPTAAPSAPATPSVIQPGS